MSRFYTLVVFFVVLLANTAMAQTPKVQTMLCPGQSLQDLIPPTYKVDEFRFETEIKGKVSKPTPVVVRSKGDDTTLGVIKFQDGCPGFEPTPVAEPQESFQSSSAKSPQSPVCETVVDEDEREVYDLRSFEEYGYYAGLLELGRSCDKYRGQNMANFMSRVKNGLLPADATPDPKGSAKMFAAWDAAHKTTSNTTANNNSQLVAENQSLREQLKIANQQIATLKNHQPANTNANSSSNATELEQKVSKLEVELNDAIGERDAVQATSDQWKKQFVDTQKQLDDLKSAQRAAQLPGTSGSSGSAPSADQAAPAKSGSEITTSQAFAKIFVPWKTELVPVRNYGSVGLLDALKGIQEAIKENGDNQTRNLWQTSPEDICGENLGKNSGFAAARALVGEPLCQKYWQNAWTTEQRTTVNWTALWMIPLALSFCGPTVWVLAGMLLKRKTKLATVQTMPKRQAS